MSPEPRDWDKELAAIDRVMARQGTPGTPPATAAPAPLPAGRASGSAALFTWIRVLLGLLLAAGMTQWPYLHGCGLNLFLYLGAVGAVIVAGLWSSITSWTRRLGLAHTLSLLVVLWGLLLAAREVLPRTGYAKTSQAWFCP